ncbi:NAD(P)H-dependent glycerol-3-phosphate dehydrogenase [Caproiciproducens galactitolivorans]|uniref:Glycerol-3-phosphate dehydrogenase n=1 Tax=Caproiciproducens galactitolivorans TaxID=642589 RepID=A0A4Z0YBB8_9FIRM|nr:NAD(P)H-dependent glycerol-3-phosphate dehydrogenase [Caproiciproducens galactitolivorans]QEY33623.1 NAD(P)H-dependent glycerol-3-phosphate dehydrogenase [Caproiciproducens galactitolivorans]TGJ76260.1 glycerol-3-phosphate dehydrogenase [Caproiciproducens galactitolivorans]
MNITVIGCGRWGSFIAWYLDRLNHTITLYGHENSSKLQAFLEQGTNGMVTLGEGILLTSDLEKAVAFAEILVISIGAQGFRGLMRELAAMDLGGKTIVLCMKGLEADTGKRLTQIAQEYAPKVPSAIWVGPGHVQNFVRGIPNCMVIDSVSMEIKEYLVKAFSSDLIRFYYGTDLIGNEVGAAAKNVIGIAGGMLDGLNRTALKGALMSRGTREIARLIQAMGGNEITAYGLSHLGDYEATVFSEYSHNRKFGELFVKGKDYGELAEGVATTTALLKLGQEYNVELPICRAVYSVIHEGREPKTVLSDLFLRSLKMEF